MEPYGWSSVRDHRTLIVQFHTGTAEIVRILIAYRGLVLAGLDERHPAAIVHHVQRRALQFDGIATAVKFAIDLESSDIDSVSAALPVVIDDDFTRPLAIPIIQVVRRPCRLTLLDNLRLGLGELVPEIPSHHREMRHPGHVAVLIVFISPVKPADARASQTVAGRDFPIVIVPLPTTIGTCLVDQVQDVADSVKLVMFPVSSHRPSIAG